MSNVQHIYSQWLFLPDPDPAKTSKCLHFVETENDEVLAES